MDKKGGGGGNNRTATAGAVALKVPHTEQAFGDGWSALFVWTAATRYLNATFGNRTATAATCHLLQSGFFF